VGTVELNTEQVGMQIIISRLVHSPPLVALENGLLGPLTQGLAFYDEKRHLLTIEPSNLGERGMHIVV
jgi:hypothetical protein